MRKLKFIVQGQKIKPDPSCDFNGLIAGSVGYLQAEFRLDGAWDGCQVAASFWRGAEENAAVIKDGACVIPAEALLGQYFGVSLTGVKRDYRITTNKVFIKQGGALNGNG